VEPDPLCALPLLVSSVATCVFSGVLAPHPAARSAPNFPLTESVGVVTHFGPYLAAHNRGARCASRASLNAGSATVYGGVIRFSGRVLQPRIRSRWVLAGFPTYEKETMASIDSSERTITTTFEPYTLDEAQLAAVAFLARYSGRTLDAYRHHLRNLFQWQPITIWPSWRPRERTWSYIAPRWRSEGWPRRPSTGARRPRAASTALPTSTAGSRPTRPSTSADRPFTPASGGNWTGRSWAVSFSRRSGSTMPMPRWRCCSG